MAAGITITFSFHRCRGPITSEEGVVESVKKAFERSGVTVVGELHITPFPDGTINVTADLAESHSGLGTYSASRFVRGDVSMCFETTDNTELARKLVRCLEGCFNPGEVDLNEERWQSR
mgnify:CR=1 FL=1